MNPQKSEVHDTTDDATTSPASNFETGAAAKDVKIGRRAAEEPNPGQADAILGAGDSTSGGGNASGNPDGDTQERSGTALKGDRAEDREKLFPEGVHVKRDESDIGGPIDVEVDSRE